MNWTIGKILDWSTGFFAEKAIESPRLDAELLLSKILKLSRVQLYVQFDRPLSEIELSEFKSLLKRRAVREPLAYITGEREFFSLNFIVSPAVLIPRSETEELVDMALAYAKTAKPDLKILDLATGSGCILISLLKHLPQATGIGVDLSEEALRIARENASRHDVTERVQWMNYDLRDSWHEAIPGSFDLITANPPYIAAAEHRLLQPEVRNFEPYHALIPGASGVEAFTWILPNLSHCLTDGGLAVLEMAQDQSSQLIPIAERYFIGCQFDIVRDLSGHERFLRVIKTRTEIK